MFAALGKYKDIGLLIIRIGLGIMFVMHGYPKIGGGVEMWEKLGGAMSNVGINAFPAAWGFLAAVTEFVGGIFLVLGFVFRPAALFLFITMIVAALMHLAKGDGIMGSSHAIELAFVFFGLIFIGPGKYSIDKK